MLVARRQMRSSTRRCQGQMAAVQEKPTMLFVARRLAVWACFAVALGSARSTVAFQDDGDSAPSDAAPAAAAAEDDEPPSPFAASEKEKPPAAAQKKPVPETADSADDPRPPPEVGDEAAAPAE